MKPLNDDSVAFVENAEIVCLVNAIFRKAKIQVARQRAEGKYASKESSS